MTRIMVDAADPVNIPSALTKQLVAGYLTGTPGTKWAGHWNDFPGMTMVTIDQAALPGAPAYSAMVMDVEPLCYRPGDISSWMSHATAPRPTVYCDRTDYPAVRAVWSGDLWLAAPSIMTNPFPDDNKIVAIQHTFAGNYDASIVFDDTWPLGPTPTPKEANMITDMIDSGAERSIPFPAGSFKTLMLLHDFTTSPNLVRVAVHSKSAGHYTQIVEVDVTTSNPTELAFTASDADGVSLVNRSAVPMGWTLA